jgi:hypothetical protein
LKSIVCYFREESKELTIQVFQNPPWSVRHALSGKWPLGSSPRPQTGSTNFSPNDTLTFPPSANELSMRTRESTIFTDVMTAASTGFRAPGRPSSPATQLLYPPASVTDDLKQEESDVSRSSLFFYQWVSLI